MGSSPGGMTAVCNACSVYVVAMLCAVNTFLGAMAGFVCGKYVYSAMTIFMEILFSVPSLGCLRLWSAVFSAGQLTRWDVCTEAFEPDSTLSRGWFEPVLTYGKPAVLQAIKCQTLKCKHYRILKLC